MPAASADAGPKDGVPRRLANATHPLVKATAWRLTEDETTQRGRLQRIFDYVRDIPFAFPEEGDFVSASETIALGHGQCNTKGTLLLALCKAAGVPARIHFSLISKEIQHGPFRGLFYRLFPNAISHSWIEVEIDGEWRRVDSYINDLPFFRGAVNEVRRRGWQTGFSVTRDGGEPSAELDLNGESFSQMGAVSDDHGIWEDPADYYASDLYRNRPSRLKQRLYRWAIRGANERVAAVRRAGQQLEPSKTRTMNQVPMN